MTRRIPLLLLPLLALPLPARAADKTVDIPTLGKMVANLGYEDSGNKKNNVIINSVNNTDHAITMRVIGDGGAVYVDIPFDVIPKEKMAAAPLDKMLNYNDTGDDYFAFSTDDKDLFFPELQAKISAGELTPQLLRATIDRLVAEANDTRELWDTAKWSTATASKGK